MAAPDSKESRQIWRAEEKRKKQESKIEVDKATHDAYNGPSTVEEYEAKSDWDRLTVTAQLKFPGHLAEKFNLRPVQRLAAIAFTLGWTIEKISTASGTHRTTVSRWLNHDDNVKEFVKAFEYHTGGREAKELIDNEQYTSIQVLRDLRDDPSVSASTRKEIAIWMFEQKHGKAKESKEIKGINIRDLTEQLKAAKTSATFGELESELTETQEELLLDPTAKN